MTPNTRSLDEVWSEIDFRPLPLTRGKVAIVSVEDYEVVSRFKWHYGKGNRSAFGYARRKIRLPDGREGFLQLHHAILKPPAGFVVDHINRDPLDNRRCNLRIATLSQNQMNKALSRINRTGFKGVSERDGTFIAQIKVNGRQCALGSYRTAEEAGEAYRIASLKFQGEFSCYANHANRMAPAPNSVESHLIKTRSMTPEERKARDEYVWDHFNKSLSPPSPTPALKEADL